MIHVWPVPSEPRSHTRSLPASDGELRIAFQALATPRDVAQLLDIPYWQLAYLVLSSPLASRYRAAEIKKKAGGTRRLLVPSPGIAAVQRKLAQVLAAVYQPRPCVCGFVKDRSILTNARRHVRRPWVMNVDIADFFPKINYGRVRGVFRAKPYGLPDPVATLLAQICCHDNQLPQGAPTSPIVSNMVCARLDGELLGLAKRHRLTYSRFADDLTFSTTLANFPPEVGVLSAPAPLAVAGPELTRVIHSNGFEINARKSRLQSRRERQEVTGITVSAFPNVPRWFVRRVRAMLHAWEKFGYDAAELEYWTRYNRRHRAPHRKPVRFRNVVRGHIAYLAMIRGAADPIVAALRARYGRLDPAFARSVPRPLHETVTEAMWVLECETDMVQGTAFAIPGIGLVTCEHVVGVNSHAFRTDRPDSKTPVTVLARSKELDLALLQAPDAKGAGLRVHSQYTPNVGDQVNVAGFPNHQIGDSGYFLPQRIVSLRRASGHLRALVEGPVAAGMSGGPVVDANGMLLGVIVSGAEVLSQANMTERHGFIPVSTLVDFLSQTGHWPI